MKPYADINFYLNTFGGTGSAAARFPYFAAKATKIIYMYAGAKIDEKSVPDCVKQCCCELVDLLAAAEDAAASTDGVKSETVGDWSKTFEDTSSRRGSFHAAVEQCVETWLTGTGLLFRGVR